MVLLLLLMASCMSPTPVLGGGPCLPYIAAAQAGSTRNSIVLFSDVLDWLLLVNM
jgi:hypothetical protein